MAVFNAAIISSYDVEYLKLRVQFESCDFPYLKHFKKEMGTLSLKLNWIKMANYKEREKSTNREIMCLSCF